MKSFSENYSHLIDKNKQWKKVIGYEKHYLVSDHGDIFSIPRYSKNNNMKYGGIFLKTYKSKSGYLYFKTGASGKRIAYSISRIVAESFFGQIPKGYEVNHKDGNKLNNEVTNLEVVSKSTHTLHTLKLERYRSKITSKQVFEIKNLIEIGLSYPEIAKKYGITRHSVGLIKRGKTWRHLL